MPDFDTIAALIAPRILAVPRLRQVLHTHLLDLGPPVWAEDPNLDLSRHIHLAALPHELGPEQPDAVWPLRGNGFRGVGHREIDIDPGAGDLRGRFGRRRAVGDRDRRGIDPTGYHLSARPVHGDRCAVMVS